MNLNDIAALAEILNAVGVIVTLVILIVSIRQNTRSQRAVAVDSLAAGIAAINVPAIESPAVGSALERTLADWSAATREERIISHYFLFSFFKLSENAWYQQRQGILDHEQWVGWERGVRKFYHSRGVREVWWPSRHNAYSAQFQDYLSTTTEPSDFGGLSELFSGRSSGG
ncbi:MAG: hypothetical protein U1F08_12480 [Steroidobacteraceae bacterium]